MVALNDRRTAATAWAPPLGEVTTLVATTTGTWPAGTRMLVGLSTETIAQGTVLGTVSISVDGLTATWALSEADCAVLRAHTHLLVQVPSGASWEGVLAGRIMPESVWSGAHSTQVFGTVAVGPRGPEGPDGTPGADGAPGADGLPGADGEDGREVELQTSATHVQWRYVGDVAWTDLIALTAITGPAGADGADGAAGADGDDGLSVELQTTATHIQWRQAGGTWADLVALSTITGPAGTTSWTGITDKPAVIGAGATQADARAAIGAGTSSLVIGTTAGTAKAGDYAPDLSSYLTSAAAASAYAPLSGQFAVNTVAASGAAETLPATHAAHKVTMDENCTFTFTSPTAGHAFVLLLLGAFTPTWPASVDWAGGTAPTYASGTLYHFATLDGGTTWLGSGQAYS